MSTFVFFHAHPDDEAIVTGCSIAVAADAGHRVVIAYATRGEQGEMPPDGLASGETLADRREAEARAAARILGAQTVDFLGFRDSGMAGDPTNDMPDSFWSADIDVAARRLAHTLASNQADVLVVYDANGGYGHPDHIRVHQVGLRAARLAGTRIVYEATLNRDFMVDLVRAARDSGLDLRDLPDEAALAEFGVPESRITTMIRGAGVVDRKRLAMEAHASQIAETSIFLSLPPEAFALTWGNEWFIRNRPSRPHRSDPLGELGVELVDGWSPIG